MPRGDLSAASFSLLRGLSVLEGIVISFGFAPRFRQDRAGLSAILSFQNPNPCEFIYG